MQLNGGQTELFGLVWWRQEHPFRLRPNDVVRINGKLGLVIRVNECAAVILMNRSVRQFTTRFDKPVRFQPPPFVFRISPDSEIEILNRKNGQTKSGFASAKGLSFAVADQTIDRAQFRRRKKPPVHPSE